MYRQFGKRFLDIFLLVLTLPVFLLLVIILLISGSMVFNFKPLFVQVRLGKGAQAFLLIKLRSMHDYRDEYGQLLPDDQRRSRYGDWLRRTSLDELPQWLNVFQGNMSFIGPRPLLQKYLPYYTAEEQRRHTVLPGITGYAQVAGRNAVSWDDKLQLDAYYAENLSFKLDVFILKETFRILFSRNDSFYEPPERLDVYRTRTDMNQDLEDS